jgi:cell division protein FtsI/penicillin-binding protein 2
MNYFSVKDKVDDALEKYRKSGTRYYILIPEASSIQYKSILNLTNPPLDPKTNKPIYSSFRNYILSEPINSRIYPENSLLAATLGFVRENTASDDILKIDTCTKMLRENESRQTESREGYTTGQYGVERAYCSVLAGLNGKISFSTNGTSQYSETPTVEGSDIVLTIDKNLQSKAEEVLQKAIDANSNQNGKPIGGTILVSEVATGRILAQASYPFFDPNNVTQLDYEVGAIKNQASVAYDPGSVIKPLTIASARDVYEKGKVKANGKRIGVPIDFTAEDVDEKGLVFTSTDGRESIVSNADKNSFKGVQSSLSDILRNSINTLIAKIQKDYMDSETTRYYFLEKFKLGDWSDSFLYTSEPPNTRNFDRDLNSPFSYANMAFGQGFTTTPLNIIRAYSAIANKGCLVEPRIVESIGEKPFRQYEKDCTQVIDAQVADEVVHMLQNTLEVGFGNGEQTRPSRAKMDKYTGAAKTGTAQIARPLTKLDKDGNLVKVPCNYTCNSNLGLFDHTFVGFAPASNPKIIVLVKISQPKPGDRNFNYAEFSSAQFWKEITEYSLGYLGVRPDR